MAYNYFTPVPVPRTPVPVPRPRNQDLPNPVPIHQFVGQIWHLQTQSLQHDVCWRGLVFDRLGPSSTCCRKQDPLNATISDRAPMHRLCYKEVTPRTRAGEPPKAPESQMGPVPVPRAFVPLPCGSSRGRPDLWSAETS